MEAASELDSSSDKSDRFVFENGKWKGPTYYCMGVEYGIRDQETFDKIAKMMCSGNEKGLLDMIICRKLFPLNKKYIDGDEI